MVKNSLMTFSYFTFFFFFFFEKRKSIRSFTYPQPLKDENDDIIDLSQIDMLVMYSM